MCSIGPINSHEVIIDDKQVHIYIDKAFDVEKYRPYALREKIDNSSAFVHHIGNVDEEEHLLLLEVNQLVDVLFCFVKFECAQFGDTKFCLDYYELG